MRAAPAHRGRSSTSPVPGRSIVAVTLDRDRAESLPGHHGLGTEGGTEIEEVAAKPTPDAILKEHGCIRPSGCQELSMPPKLAFGLGLVGDPQVSSTRRSPSSMKSGSSMPSMSVDASLVEINPLVVTKDG